VILVDSPDVVLAGHVHRELTGGTTRLPTRALTQAGGGPWATDPTDSDGLKALERVFEVEIAIGERPGDARIGTRALVKFRLDDEPLGWQLVRRARQLFLARLEL